MKNKSAKDRLEELELYDGTEISCYIDGQFIENALFRFVKASETCFIEQDVQRGSSLLEHGLSFIKYKFSWCCFLLEDQDSIRFSDGVDLTPFFEKQNRIKLSESGVIPISFQAVIKNKLVSTTIISVPNSSICISNVSTLNLDDNQRECIKKYFDYIKSKK